MESEVVSEVQELGIEIHNGPDVPLASGKGVLCAQTLVVRYVNAASQNGVDFWYVSSVDVYGPIRSKVTDGLTARRSKVCYDNPQDDCPAELLDEVRKHAPGQIWNILNAPKKAMT